MFLASLVALAPALYAHAVSVQRENYHRWSKAVRISNGLIDMVVVPEVGRIMRFGEVGKPNLLFEGVLDHNASAPTGDWKNWGGDKVWPAPQASWGWPPEPEYDGSAWDLQVIPDGVRMTSRQVSAKLGLRFERRITLSRGTPEAKVLNVLINDSGKEVELAPWQVCQVDDPDECTLALRKTPEMPTGWRVYAQGEVKPVVSVRGNRLHVRRDAKHSHKIGGASDPEEVSALVHGYRLTLTAAFRRGAKYTDGGCADQIYTNPDPIRYAELELTAPLVPLAPGGSAALEVKMRISRP